MELTDVRELEIFTVENDSLPHRVILRGKEHNIEGAGIELADALLRVFSVCGLFSTNDPKELASFIFQNFGDEENWGEAISALSL